jgi:hypothetical protein
MLTSAVQFYDVVVFVHIMTVILAFGPTYAYPVFLTAAARRGGRAIPSVADGILMWDRIASTAGVVVILATGIYLAADRWEFSDFFISWGFLAIIVLAGLAHGYFIPRTRKMLETAERDIAAAPGDEAVEFSDDFRAMEAQMNKVGPAAGLLVLVTVYVMTAKPFL